MGNLFRFLINYTKRFRGAIYLFAGIFCGFYLYFLSSSVGVESLGVTYLSEFSNDLAANPIVPFSPVKVRLSTDANRTLKTLDLWTNDDNCTKFNVSLLEDKSIQSRALVSFPGSGNTWLRMLVMGVTGIYIDSVYGGDDALFESKGSLLS